MVISSSFRKCLALAILVSVLATQFVAGAHIHHAGEDRGPVTFAMAREDAGHPHFSCSLCEFLATALGEILPRSDAPDPGPTDALPIGHQADALPSLSTHSSTPRAPPPIG